MAERLEDDPGWTVSWSTILWMLIPGFGLQRQLRRVDAGEVDALSTLRHVFLGFSVLTAGFGLVTAVLYLTSVPPRDPSTLAAAGLLAVSALGVGPGRRLEPPLRCDDDAALAESYRSRFFLRVAFAQSPALVGFVGFFLTYAWWPYPVGLAIAAIGLRRAAPTPAALVAEQDELALHGCPRSLVGALRRTRPST